MNAANMQSLDQRIGPDTQRGSPKRAASLLIAFLSGLLLTTSFPPADIGWLAFGAIVPFLKLFPFTKSRTAFLHGFVFALAYFCGLLYWIAVFAATKIGGFGVTAWFVLSARESLWVGLFAILVNYIWNRGLSWGFRVAAVASLWTFFEWIRQLGPLGFGWGDLAYSQWKFIPLLQIASVTGIWGISWLIVAVNTAISSFQLKPIAGTVIAVALVLGWGTTRMQSNDHFSTSPTEASALQANIFEDVPYNGTRPENISYFYRTLAQFDHMAAAAKRQSGSTICVTAETSIPGYPTLDPDLRRILSAIAVKNKITLIVGARAVDALTGNDTNSVFLFAPYGSMVGPYNKQQLVPFGEYVPGRKEMPFLNSFHVLDYDMQPGRSNQTPLNAGGGVKAGVAICYESTYPRFMREQVRSGATFDVVVTDDAWYGRTAAAKQHLAMSVLRAVETDRYLVRCASTGISAIVDPHGYIEASAPLFTNAVVTARIYQRHNLSPFVRLGDWWIWFCLCIVILTVVQPRHEPKLSDISEVKA